MMTLLLAGLGIFAQPVAELFAQPRSFEIAAATKRVDGIKLGVHPGDTIRLAPGDRSEIRFDHITGSAERPVIVINSGGKVVIRTKAGYGILFNNSVHFRLTGTGGSDKYGIEIAATGNHGLAINEFSSYCEADHLEIHDVGYAGITAKTDPNCLRKDLRFFIMKNLSFHHNLIYNTGSEGFYIGYSWHPYRVSPCSAGAGPAFAPGGMPAGEGTARSGGKKVATAAAAGGEDSLLYSHEIHGLHIFDNILRNTAAEAIQSGCATRDVMIYGNNVCNYGTKNGLWQNHGIQIKACTTGDFFSNIVSTGPGDGISYYGRGENRVYHNLLINTGGSGIYHSDAELWPGGHYEITDNTIVNPSEFGVTLDSKKSMGNLLRNNLFVLAPAGKAVAIAGSGVDRWDSSGNRVVRQGAGALGSGGSGGGLGAYDSAAYALDTVYDFERSVSTDMIVEPEPFAGIYTFKSDAGNVQVYNEEGLLLPAAYETRHRGKISVDLSRLPEGCYYVSEGRGHALRRVVKTGEGEMQAARHIMVDSVIHGFYEFLPAGYESNVKRYPLILFLHGLGECGNGESDLPKVLRNGLPHVIGSGLFGYEFIVISPQFTHWPWPQDVAALFDYAVSHYRVDSSRIYVTGLSMGGGATWDFASSRLGYTSRLAAIVPVCGASGPDSSRAAILAGAWLPIWATHNDGDPVVPVSNTETYFALINGRVPAPAVPMKKTIFPVKGHNAWTTTYDPAFRQDGMNIYEWMLQFKR